MDKFMDSPWFLRLTALLLAIILFFSVQSDEGNLSSKTVGDQLDIIREVPVEVYYDDENLVVTGVPETVNVKIEGPINIVQTTKLLKDFTLFVDLRELTMGEHHVRIKHENISEKLQVRLDPSTIDVLIEEKITQTFRVDPELNQRLLAENFHVVGMDVTPSTIEVTGAKSVVDSISFVKATASSDGGINKSFEQEAKVRVLDRDLNKLNVTVTPEHVTVKVEVSENSKEVPIVLKTHGSSPSNIAIDSLTAEPEVITLYGPSVELDGIEQVTVDVDLSKIKGQGTLDVEVKKPKGISSISTTKIKVNVKATVIDKDTEISDGTLPGEEIPTETVKFESIPIAVMGLDGKFKSTLIEPANGSLTLAITGEVDIMRTIKKSEFALSIDASEITDVGEVRLPVLVSGRPDVVWELSSNEVLLKIELV